MTMLEEALAYASQGFHVFPILPGQKRPLTQHGFKEATTDREQIRAWWTMHPTANIGWHLDASGMCAIDLDIGAPMGLDLPVTMTVKTPSGGRHMIYEGRIPSSQSKLAPHVDTRGVGGYTLLPPSIVDGRAYEFIGDEWPQPVPQWIVAFFATSKPGPRERVTEDIDTPVRIDRIREIAAAWEPAANLGKKGGGGSLDRTMELVNRLLDLCSHDPVFEALWELWVPRCAGEWTEEWVSQRVYTTKKGSGRESDIGCEVYPIVYSYTPPENGFNEEWDRKTEEVKEEAMKQRRERFGPVKPSAFLTMKDPVFWDETNVLPRNDDEGATVLLYGQPGSHKTNLTLTLMFDLLKRGVRVLYAAGEGSLGVGKKRVPAHMVKRGLENVDDLLAIVRAVPLLQDKEQVEAFVGACADFAPNVVVIDTLATASAGLDENSSAFSSLLTDNGPVGWIKRVFKATVVIIAHEGKAGSARGVRGHSGLLGNVDAALNVQWEKQAPRGALYVHKMRDGKDGFSLYAKVALNCVPVPEWITKEEYEAGKPKATSSNLWAAWAEALKLLGAIRKDTAATMNQVTEKMLMLHPHLSKSQDGLRKQLEAAEDRLAGYQVGRGKAGAWLYAYEDEKPSSN